MSVDVSAIRAAFAACNLELEKDAATTCVSICTEFGLSSDDMAAQWDAYSMNQQLSGAADADGLVAFRSHLKQQKAKAKEPAPAATQKRRQSKTPVLKREADSQDTLESLYSVKSPDGKHARPFSSPQGSNKVQRTSGMFSPSSMQSPPSSSYEKRTDAGKTVSEFNEHLKTQIIGMEDDSGRPVKIAAPFPSRNLAPNASYMYTPLFQRAIALDEQLVEYEELVKEKFKLEELKPVGDPSPAQVTVVGRIVCEAAEGKLNPSVVQIEGSRKTCGGQRVLLDLSGVPNFQVFPGKVSVGLGCGVACFGANNLCMPIPAPPATSTPARIKEIQGEHGKPVRVLTACGPFTTTSNVDYLPLNDLLQIATDQKPDVLILVVMTLLNNVFAKDEQIQIVVVPSLRDANHENVYPQPPLNKKKACEAFEAAEYAKVCLCIILHEYHDLKLIVFFSLQRVHFMSNPCTFSINGVVFGTSALDVVVQLSSNELFSVLNDSLYPSQGPYHVAVLVLPQRSPDTSPLTSKELLIGRIKQNFDLETQSWRQRESSTTEQSQEGRDETAQVLDQLRRMKRRCAKLERKLQEKDAEIKALQDQQQLRFPLLMHETMRSLRSLEDNQSDRTASALPLSHSMISDMAQERRDADARIHEYEQQVSCYLDGRSRAAIGKVHEVQTALFRMVSRSNLVLPTQRAQQEDQQQILSKQLEDIMSEALKWEGIVGRKNELLQQSRDQICEQQLTIEHLKADLKILEKRHNRPGEHRLEDDDEELKRTISTQRAALEDAQATVRQLTAENEFLRGQQISQHGEGVFQDETVLCAAHDTYDKLLIQVRQLSTLGHGLASSTMTFLLYMLQVRFVRSRLQALKELVQTYEETSTININLLDESQEDFSLDENISAQSCEGYAIQLSGSILEATRVLSELQQEVEDACARLMGSTCALQ
ncbi:unnamed protein product [Phytophthora lilii]|uniref:DNA polymerase alpha subunit B n=1 Tax=Phytophthora lilii TaxID=2077276 RepID=A0A9W6T7V4_9STRA|nr:unnamed protein product [Phytophthora lilii]